MALTITQAGLNQAVQASANGISLDITHVALGTAGYTPSRSATSLQAEVARSPISGGANVSDTQIHLTAVFNDNNQFSAKEIGFFLSDGTLFAVDSHPTDVLIYKHSSATLIEAFDLTLDAVPASSITVNTTGDLSLYYAEEFTNFSRSINGNAYRQIQMQSQLDDQAEQIRVLNTAINYLSQQAGGNDLI